MTKNRGKILANKLNAAADLLAHAQYEADLTLINQDLLHDLHLLAETVESATRTAVEECRAAGMSWREIAYPLGGVTKQGAQQRYGA